MRYFPTLGILCTKNIFVTLTKVLLLKWTEVNCGGSLCHFKDVELEQGETVDKVGNFSANQSWKLVWLENFELWSNYPNFKRSKITSITSLQWQHYLWVPSSPGYSVLISCARVSQTLLIIEPYRESWSFFLTNAYFQGQWLSRIRFNTSIACEPGVCLHKDGDQKHCKRYQYQQWMVAIQHKWLNTYLWLW